MSSHGAQLWTWRLKMLQHDGRRELIVLGTLLTIARPAAWLFVVIALATEVLVGFALIANHRSS